ncbi:MAG: helix-turn-helix transcriptional regulator [Jejuia sp.]
MQKISFTPSHMLKEGHIGLWWHEGMRGPLSKLSFISQFGDVKVSKINIDENMGPHINNGIEFHFIKSGVHKWSIKDDPKEKVMYPGDLSITAPWVVHGNLSKSINIGHVYWMVITPNNFGVKNKLDLGKWSTLPENFQKNLGQLLSKKSGIVLNKLKHFEYYFKKISEELLNQYENYEIKVTKLIELFLIDVWRELEKKQELNYDNNEFLILFENIVMSDLAKKWELENLASFFGMSKTSFNQKVKEVSGFPPKSLIINLRLNEAKYRIEKNETFTDIAFSCGFSSLQHFTYTFRKRTGVTPSEFKKSLNNKND